MKKNKNTKIKVIFNLNAGEIICQNYFDITTKLRDIFSYFERNYSNKGFKLKKEYSFLNKKLKPYNSLSDLLFLQKNSDLNNNEICIEVIQQNTKPDDNGEIYKKILFPKINPFELIEYNPSESKIRYIKYQGQAINFSSLYKFSKESSFCNSENELYMSGGLYNGRTLNNFWIVDKKDYQIYKKTMPLFKKYHSMLYIPDNFVLVAGGDSLTTFIYDIENKTFIKWAFMNRKHFHPGLILLGDYVYCFSSLIDKKEEKNYFERSDLTSKNPNWEKINPIFPDFIGGKNEIFSLFFGISKNLKDEIIFLGGDKNKNRYRYNPIINKMYLSEEKNFEISFWDKTFYSINDKYRVGIPIDFPNEHTLYFLNKNNEQLTKVICSPKNDKDYLDVYFDINSEEKNQDNEDGIISIKTNDAVVKDDEDLIEKEIIFMEDFSKKNEDLKLNKEHNKKEHLYLPNYIIEEKFIDRELIPDKLKDTEFTIYEIFTNRDEENDKTNKKELKKSYLYLPNSIIVDQMVEREVKGNTQENGKDNNEEILYIELNQKEKLDDDNNINYKKKELFRKPLIKKEHFIIPNSAIEEQLIDRELFKFKKKKKNMELIQKNSEDIDENKNKSKEGETLYINYTNEKEKENENILNPKCSPKKQRLLYIPISSVDEQILDRKVDINDNNKLYIKRKIYKIKDDGIKNNENEILKEEEIINETNDKEKNDNLENNKIIKSEAKLYIPQYIIEERIINREVKEN